jgi:surfeit locus 1 family protein
VTRARAAVFAAIVFLLGAVCLRLGFWQLDRLGQRRARVAEIRARMAMPVVELAEASGDPDSLFYRRVHASGVFDTTNEVVLLNRARDEVPGVHLITPLRLEGSDGGILVDRGWIPVAANTPEGRAAYAIEGPIEVQGVIREAQAEPRFAFLADRTPAPGEPPLREWRVLNVEGIQGQLPYPLLPYFLELDQAAGGAQPIPDPEIDLSDGPHLSYAIQWFGFAATAFLGGGAWLYRDARRKEGSKAR